MNRPSFLVPLLIFIAINVCLDAFVAIAVLASEARSPETPWHFVFMGLLLGQFGLCCGARLRFEAMRHYTYIGFLLLPITAIAAQWSMVGYRGIQDFALVMLTAGFTALFCMGPRSLIQWKGLENRFTLKQMLVGTIFIAFACVIVINLPIAAMMGIGVFLLALPSVLASNLLATTTQAIGYSWMMVAGLVICLLFALIEPNGAQFFSMYVAQIMVLWLGGILLISLGQESAKPEVVGLPEE